MTSLKGSTPKAAKIFASSDKKIRKELAALQPRIWRFAFGLSRDRATADDLAQATCLRALEKASQFQADSTLDRWLFTLCRNIWLNDLRAAKVRRGQGLQAVDETDLPANNSDTDQIIFASEVFTKVMALPISQREAVLLAYVEGFSYAETATALNIPIGTVMSRLSAARKSMAHLNKDGC